MSNWDWYYNFWNELYENGEDEIADQLDQFFDDSYHGNVEKTEASYPALISYARSRKNVWLEILIRHWLLQMRASSNHKIGESLTEALELIKLTATEEAKGCPQNICAIDSLCYSYEAFDNIGSAEKRLLIVDETLPDVSPSVSCFGCLSWQKLGALEDIGRHQEALDLAKSADMELRKHGGSLLDESTHFYKYYIHTLIGNHYALQQYDDVLKLFKRYLASDVVDSPYHSTACLTYFELGDYERAKELLAPVEYVLQEHMITENWSCAVEKLSAKGIIPNDNDRGHALYIAAKDSENNGCMRLAFNIYHRAAKIAVLRNASVVAALRMLDMQRILPQLLEPAGADQDVGEIENLIGETLNNDAQDTAERELDTVLLTRDAAKLGSLLTPVKEDSSLAKRLLDLKIFQ